MGKVTVHNSANLTSAKCLRAGFLSSFPSEAVVFLLFVAVIAIIPLTIFLRDTARPSPKKKEVPAAAATESTVPESGESENAPPPYAPPAPSSTEAEPDKAAVNFPNPKDTAPAFVRGTLILAVLVLALVTIAFGFQYLNYCPEVDPNAPLGTWSIIGWCFYALLVLFASSGLVSWGLLCWYVGGGKKQDFMLDIMSLGVFVGVGVPFYMLYAGAVGVVRGCQKWLCGVTFEEGQDGGVEAVETDVEMQRLMKGDNNGDDYDEEEVVAGRS